MSDVYAGDPYGRGVFDARLALTEGLSALRRAVDLMVVHAVRGDSPQSTRNRLPHITESPGRHRPSGNVRSVGGRAAVPGRPPTHPGPGQRGSVEPGTVEAETDVVLPAQDTTGPPTESEPPQYPARPDPSDAAAEMWALVERAQAGESAAFGLIYDRYVTTVFSFIYYRVDNRHLAEDLTSDTFLKALKCIGSFTWQGRDLRAWLVTIARNTILDHHRSVRRRPQMTTEDALYGYPAAEGLEDSPESAVVDHITNLALLTAVKQLSPEQQECIVLRFLQAFTVAETAQVMAKKEGTVRALQYRAVQALAQLLPEGFQW